MSVFEPFVSTKNSIPQEFTVPTVNDSVARRLINPEQK